MHTITKWVIGPFVWLILLVPLPSGAQVIQGHLEGAAFKRCRPVASTSFFKR